MKNVILLLAMLVSLSGCEEDGPKTNQEHPILGTWKLVKKLYVSDVADTIGCNVGTVDLSAIFTSDACWFTVENGSTLTFSKGNKFSSTEYLACLNTGNFSLSEKNVLNLIEIAVDCPSRGDTFIRTYSYEFKQDSLFFKPYPSCFGRCGQKFKKNLNDKCLNDK